MLLYRKKVNNKHDEEDSSQYFLEPVIPWKQHLMCWKRLEISLNCVVPYQNYSNFFFFICFCLKLWKVNSFAHALTHSKALHFLRFFSPCEKRLVRILSWKNCLFFNLHICCQFKKSFHLVKKIVFGTPSSDWAQHAGFKVTYYKKK